MNLHYTCFYRSFVQVCHEALVLNSSLSTPDLMEYHESLLRNFSNFVTRLENIFNERVSGNNLHLSVWTSVYFVILYTVEGHMLCIACSR